MLRELSAATQMRPVSTAYTENSSRSRPDEAPADGFGECLETDFAGRKKRQKLRKAYPKSIHA